MSWIRMVWTEDLAELGASLNAINQSLIAAAERAIELEDDPHAYDANMLTARERGEARSARVSFEGVAPRKSGGLEPGRVYFEGARAETSAKPSRVEFGL